MADDEKFCHVCGAECSFMYAKDEPEGPICVPCFDTRQVEDQNMATMPIPELVAGIREKTESMQPLQAMVLGVLSGRLMKEYERAESLQGKIDDCEYQRCPCR